MSRPRSAGEASFGVPLRQSTLTKPFSERRSKRELLEACRAQALEADSPEHAAPVFAVVDEWVARVVGRVGFAHVPRFASRCGHRSPARTSGIGQPVLVVHGEIVDLSVERHADDYLVRFTLENGEVLEATGRTVYDPPLPFEDLADVFGFLILQSTPAQLIDRELGELDPEWEAIVAERRRANDQASRRLRTDTRGQGSPGVCHVCGRAIAPDGAFVHIGPTDWTDPSKPKTKRFVAEGTDIHGWTPFVVAHPECFAHEEGDEVLRALIAAAEER